MAAPISMKTFSGLIPKWPSSLLPATNATVAQNCEFSYGELQATNDGLQVSTLAAAAQSIYTDDGLAFFSWPGDVNAARSPIAQDQWNRLYFTDGVSFQVASRNLMSATGGAPSASYWVGVPRPTVAPTLNATASPTLAAQTWTAQFFYESGGIKYQAEAIPLTLVTSDDANEKYTWSLTVPTMQSGTPSGAAPEIELIGTNTATGVQEFDNYTTGSSFSGALANNADWVVVMTSTGATTATIEIEPSLQQGANQTTDAYVYTYVNNYGEEGPPSDPTLVTHDIGLEVSATCTLDALTGNYCPLNEIRIYRTPDSSSVASYFYVGSIFPTVTGGGPTFTYSDTVLAADLGEELASTNYYAPPQALVGVTALPNGILCGWLDNALYFCEAYMPWAWNPAAVLTFPNKIVGMLAIGSGLVVSTTAKPYVVSGVSPDAMSAAEMNISLAGVSKWSMVNVGGQAMYATHEGIMVVVGLFGSMTYSDRFFTRDKWRQLYANGLSQMRFAAWDGRLIAYSANQSFTPFMLRFDDTTGGDMTELPDFDPSCHFVSPISDDLYYVVGANVYAFNGGAALTANWQSREAVLPGTMNPGAYEVLCTGNWTVTLYSDDEDGVMQQRWQNTFTGNVRAKLPSGYRSRRFEVQLQGSGRFRELRIAETMRQLAQV